MWMLALETLDDGEDEADEEHLIVLNSTIELPIYQRGIIQGFLAHSFQIFRFIFNF